MEELIGQLKEMLASTIEIKVDENNLVITMIVKSKNQLSRNLANPNEVKTMLRMFGGMKEEIPMEIEIDNDAQKINMKFREKNDMEKVRKVMDNIWDQTAFILNQVIEGNWDVLKDIEDPDE